MSEWWARYMRLLFTSVPSVISDQLSGVHIWLQLEDLDDGDLKIVAPLCS